MEAESFIEGQKYRGQTPEERQTYQNQTCHAIELTSCMRGYCKVLYSTYINHVSVIPTNGMGPTYLQG